MRIRAVSHRNGAIEKEQRRKGEKEKRRKGEKEKRRKGEKAKRRKGKRRKGEKEERNRVECAVGPILSPFRLPHSLLLITPSLAGLKALLTDN